MRKPIFTDISSRFQKTPSGNIKITTDYDCIKQSLKNIFATVSGERVRNPLGSTLIRYLFEPISTMTARHIRNEITNVINRYEPRVELLNVQIIPTPDGNLYEVSLEYVISALNRRDVFTTRLRRLGNL